MSMWLREGKHKIYSNNSAGKSVSFLFSLSVITSFDAGFRSSAAGDAMFYVYHDYLIVEGPPRSGAGG